MICYLNGEFLPAAEARISPFDRGFLFGDGVYEVLPAYGGRLFRLPHHLRRLQNNLGAVALANPYTDADWAVILSRLLAENGGGELSLYLELTRGVAPRAHAFPANTPPTVFAYADTLTPLDPLLVKSGIAAITVPDLRW